MHEKNKTKQIRNGSEWGRNRKKKKKKKRRSIKSKNRRKRNRGTTVERERRLRRGVLECVCARTSNEREKETARRLEIGCVRSAGGAHHSRRKRRTDRFSYSCLFQKSVSRPNCETLTTTTTRFIAKTRISYALSEWVPLTITTTAYTIASTANSYCISFASEHGSVALSRARPGPIRILSANYNIIITLVLSLRIGNFQGRTYVRTPPRLPRRESRTWFSILVFRLDLNCVAIASTTFSFSFLSDIPRTEAAHRFFRRLFRRNVHRVSTARPRQTAKYSITIR